MRIAELRTFCRLLSSAKAQLLPGSRLSKHLGAGHSPPGQACSSASSDTVCSSCASHSSQRSLALSSAANIVSLRLSHGTHFAQHRSFVSSGGYDDDPTGGGEPSSASASSNSAGSSQDGLKSGQQPPQSAFEDGIFPHMHRPDIAVGTEGQLASPAADAMAEEELWKLTEEQRQAERELRAPPSGEPLYPDRRGGLAWEPFSDDDMAQDMTDYGGKIQSIDDYDEMLDRWGEMLEQGDSAGALEVLSQRLPKVPGLPSLETLLSQGSSREEQNRVMKKALQEECAARRVRIVDEKGRPYAMGKSEGSIAHEEQKEQRRVMEKALQEEYAARRVRTVDEKGRAYATGKRKSSIARVWIWEGPGHIVINGRRLDMHFSQLNRRLEVLSPFQVTDTLGFFNMWATVKGGGTMGQAQALRHGVSCALQKWDPELRAPLRAEGFLTRDPRVVERKKPGRAKARKAFQWVKR